MANMKVHIVAEQTQEPQNTHNNLATLQAPCNTVEQAPTQPALQVRMYQHTYTQQFCTAIGQALTCALSPLPLVAWAIL